MARTTTEEARRIEQQIGVLAFAGMSPKEIAAEVHRTESRVTTILKRIGFRRVLVLPAEEERLRQWRGVDPSVASSPSELPSHAVTAIQL